MQGCFTEFVQLAETGQSYEGMLAEDGADNFLPLFWFGYVPYVQAEFLKEGEVKAFEAGQTFEDCLQDIEQANPGVDPRRLRIGQTVNIPTP